MAFVAEALVAGLTFQHVALVATHAGHLDEDVNGSESCFGGRWTEPTADIRPSAGNRSCRESFYDSM